MLSPPLSPIPSSPEPRESYHLKTKKQSALSDSDVDNDENTSHNVAGTFRDVSQCDYNNKLREMTKNSEINTHFEQISSINSELVVHKDGKSNILQDEICEEVTCSDNVDQHIDMILEHDVNTNVPKTNDYRDVGSTPQTSNEINSKTQSQFDKDLKPTVGQLSMKVPRNDTPTSELLPENGTPIADLPPECATDAPLTDLPQHTVLAPHNDLSKPDFLPEVDTSLTDLQPKNNTPQPNSLPTIDTSQEYLLSKKQSEIEVRHSKEHSTTDVAKEDEREDTDRSIFEEEKCNRVCNDDDQIGKLSSFGNSFRLEQTSTKCEEQVVKQQAKNVKDISTGVLAICPPLLESTSCKDVSDVSDLSSSSSESEFDEHEKNCKSVAVDNIRKSSKGCKRNVVTDNNMAASAGDANSGDKIITRSSSLKSRHKLRRLTRQSKSLLDGNNEKAGLKSAKQEMCEVNKENSNTKNKISLSKTSSDGNKHFSPSQNLKRKSEQIISTDKDCELMQSKVPKGTQKTRIDLQNAMFVEQSKQLHTHELTGLTGKLVDKGNNLVNDTPLTSIECNDMDVTVKEIQSQMLFTSGNNKSEPNNITSCVGRLNSNMHTSSSSSVLMATKSSTSLDDVDSEVASFKLPAQELGRKVEQNDKVSTNKPSLQNSILQSTQEQGELTMPVSHAKKSVQLTKGVKTSSQCNETKSNFSCGKQLLAPVKLKQLITRRHSMFTSDDASYYSPLRSASLRIDRTRSLSPSFFMPPSPPLSPIPPSPRRSLLTPIISPLPTTPLPESVSPLPPSPKITSPPLIRGSALLHTENSSIFVPKPVSHDKLMVAKELCFNKNKGTQSSKILNTQPATSSSNTQPGMSSSNTQPGMSSSNTQPGMSSSNTQPGMSSSNTQPGMSSSNTQPGMSSSNTQPGMSSSNTQPAMSSSNTQPDMSSSNTQPAMSSSNTQPAMSSSNKSNRHIVFNKLISKNVCSNINCNTVDTRNILNQTFKKQLPVSANRALLLADESDPLSYECMEEELSTAKTVKVKQNNIKSIKCNIRHCNVSMNVKKCTNLKRVSTSSSTVSTPPKQLKVDTDNKRDILVYQPNMQPITNSSIAAAPTPTLTEINDQSFYDSKEGKNLTTETPMECTADDDDALHVVTDSSLSDGKEFGLFEQMDPKVCSSSLADIPHAERVGLNAAESAASCSVGLKKDKTVDFCRETVEAEKPFEIENTSVASTIWEEDVTNNKAVNERKLLVKESEKTKSSGISVFNENIDICLEKKSVSSTVNISNDKEHKHEEEEGEISECELVIDCGTDNHRISMRKKTDVPILETDKTLVNCKKRDRHQTEFGFTSKLLKKFENKSINKTHIIDALSDKSNSISVQTLSQVFVARIQSCDITLIPSILRKLDVSEGEENCVCLLPPGTTCSKCSKASCDCQAMFCWKCRKNQINLSKDLDTVLKNNVFKICHPSSEKMSVPIMTEFELDILHIVQELLKQRHLKSLYKTLISILRQTICMKKDMLSCERLALW